MGEVFIISERGKLSKREECFVLTKCDKSEIVIRPFQVSQLILIGKISLTAEALRFLFRIRLPVAFISPNGWYNGRLEYSGGKNIFLHQKQFQLIANPSQNCQLAKSFVIGKIKNQLTMLQRIKRKTNSEQELSIYARDLKKILNKIETTQDLASLRGLEGGASRAYFHVFDLNINPSWAQFKKRTRNPPQTNVNAVLSFLYSLLQNKVHCALEVQGLNVMASHLHEFHYGKNTLVFDMMEEFRTVLADSVCFNLFNQGILKKDDFETKIFSTQDDDFPLDEEILEENVTSKKGVVLKRKGLEKCIIAFKKKLESQVLYDDERKMSFEKIIIEQAIKYKEFILEKREEYLPFKLK